MASKYQIRAFTASRLEEVKQRWRGIAGDDEFDLELAGLFEWCAAHIQAQEGDSRAWELYNSAEDTCVAILELVDSKKGALTKLLKLFITPSLWDAESHRADVIGLYVATFAGVISQGVLRGAKDVKLYGRNDLMLSMLRSIHANWDVENTSVRFEGRFLTISISQ